MKSNGMEESSARMKRNSKASIVGQRRSGAGYAENGDAKATHRIGCYGIATGSAESQGRGIEMSRFAWELLRKDPLCKGIA